MRAKQTGRSQPSVGSRIRRRRRIIWLVVLSIVVCLSYVDRSGWLLVPHADDMATYHGIQGRVTRVIDGDTFEIDIPDRLNQRPVTRVRLWGINCPELASFDREAEPLAQEAADMTKRLIEGGLVTLSLEPQRMRGTFGRVLAHVDIPDQGNLNIALLEAGLTITDERWPHRQLARYAKAQRQAKRKEIGLWEPASVDEESPG